MILQPKLHRIVNPGIHSLASFPASGAMQAVLFAKRDCDVASFEPPRLYGVPKIMSKERELDAWHQEHVTATVAVAACYHKRYGGGSKSDGCCHCCRGPRSYYHIPKAYDHERHAVGQSTS
jgi:hypothetical protein